MNRTPRIVLLAVFIVTGCATVHETYAPDGRKAYALNCSGLARGWDKCFATAGELCGAKGYDVIDRNGEPVSATSFVANNSGASGFAGSTFERSMTIACKAES